MGGKSAPEHSLQGTEALSQSTPAAEGREHQREDPQEVGDSGRR